jgi:hypothetical protein
MCHERHRDQEEGEGAHHQSSHGDYLRSGWFFGVPALRLHDSVADHGGDVGILPRAAVGNLPAWVDCTACRTVTLRRGGRRGNVLLAFGLE